ncbi:MAG: tyrosine-type recombinase/integrase [Pseudomonadales bacterium]
MNQRYALAKLISKFFNQHLPLQRGASPNTIIAYQDAFKLLFCFISKKTKRSCDEITLEDFDRDTIVAFLNDLEKTKKCTTSTRNARLAAISSFFKFVAYEEPTMLEQCSQIRGIPIKKTVKPIIQYYDESEMSALLKAIDTDTLLGKRDYALMLLLYNTGVRAQEVCDLTIDDVRLDNTAQVLIHGKGGKQRSCPLWSETVNAIKIYLTERSGNTEENQAMFLNNRSTILTRFGLRYIVRKYAEIASIKEKGIKRKTNGPHLIRHTTAMHLLRSGNDINMISMWLGHADIKTTHGYIELDIEMKREMLEKRRVNLPEKKRKMKPKWGKESVLSWLDSLVKPAALCGV